MKPWGLGLLCVMSVAFSANAADHCRAVKISDGDTLTVRCAGKKTGERVRLMGIDAPEMLQKNGKNARRALARICQDADILMDRFGKDQYQRTLAKVTCNGVDAQKYMIDHGWAWVYRSDAADYELKFLEAKARDAKRGLWQDKNPKPPWRYRLNGNK